MKRMVISARLFSLESKQRWLIQVEPLQSQRKQLRSLLQLSAVAATRSTGVGRTNNNRLGAVVFGKRKTTVGWNSYKTHPKLRHYEYPCLHAEAHAMIKHGLDNCLGCDILVTRILRDGSLTMAKPCNECQQLMRSHGIRQVYYTDWNGDIQVLDH